MSIRFPVTLVALALLGVVLAPVAPALPSECQFMPELDADDGRVGRPCLTVSLDAPCVPEVRTCVENPAGESACIPWETLSFPADRNPICTYYIFLTPLGNGGSVLEPEPESGILYAETNGLSGLQTTKIQGRAPDQPLLVLRL